MNEDVLKKINVVFKAERDEFIRYLNTRRFQPKTDMDRLLSAAHARALEIAADGVPKTPYPQTNNP